MQGSKNSGFKGALILIVSLSLTAIFAENASRYLILHYGKEAGYFLPALLLSFWIWLSRKSLVNIIVSPYFSTTCLLSIAAGTALGTFIIQNRNTSMYESMYGNIGSTVIRFLRVNDVFHSWWYVSLFVILGVSLITISFRKKFHFSHLGFYLAHLSPVWILIGFWIDYFYGFRGIVSLETGEETNIVQVYTGNSNQLTGIKELPFSIRLNRFSTEKFEPEYRVQIWKSQVESGHPGNGHTGLSRSTLPELITTFPLAENEIRHIYHTDIYFRLNEFYPNFQFEYGYPMETDTIVARDPGVMLVLNTPAGKPILQLRAHQNHTIREPHLNALLEFYWDLPEELVSITRNANPLKQNSEVVRIVFHGAGNEVIYLSGDEFSRQELKRKEYYSIPGKNTMGYQFLFFFQDAQYMTAVPASQDDQLLNPVAKVEVWGREWATSREAFLFPSASTGRKGGSYMIPGTPYFLALGSLRDLETKFWRSEVSVVDTNGYPLKTKAIEVNKPMYAGGYRFYQTDYDENNPEFSGIGVSYNPGLWIVYSGFTVLFVSCIALLLMKPHLDHRNPEKPISNA